MHIIKSNNGILGMSIGELEKHIQWLQHLAFQFSISGNDKAAEHLVLWRLIAEDILEQKGQVWKIMNKQL